VTERTRREHGLAAAACAPALIVWSVLALASMPVVIGAMAVALIGYGVVIARRP